MTNPATHPCALAEARAHPQDDAVVSAQASAEALELRLAALSILSETTDAARTEIRAVRRELDRLAGHAEGGAGESYWTWYRSSVSAIRTAAARLFPGEAWVVDVSRGPAWTPL